MFVFIVNMSHHSHWSLPGKKARTFDLDAIFETTRRTAVERSQRVLGGFIDKYDNDKLCGNNQWVCNHDLVHPVEEREKETDMEEEGGSSKSAKPPVKAAAAASR